jgi:hypothetical protein
MDEQYKAARTLSKRSYYELQQRLTTQFPNDTHMIDAFLATFRDVLKFDPTINTYESVKQKIAPQLLNGMTVIEARNQKKYYELHKEELNRKRNERRKKTT